MPSQPLSTTALVGAILEASLDCIIVIDQDNTVVEWNTAAERTFGYSRLEAVEHDLSALIIPERYREGHERGLQRYLTTRVAYLVNNRVQIEARRRGGEIFPCEIAFHPLEFEGRTYFAAYLRDLSDQRRAEQERSRLARVTEASKDFIAFADLDNQLMYINDAGRRLVGYEGEIPAGASLSDIVHPDDRARLLEEAWPQVRAQGHWEGEMRLVHQRSGEVIDVHRTIFALTDPITGEAFGYATVTRDIRERKRVERERQAWQEDLERQVAERTRELQQLNAELDAFSYSISHDLRAPIRHVMGFTGLLRQSVQAGDSAKSERYLGVIEQSATRMGSLVDALLGLARQSREPLRRELVDLGRVAEQVRADLGPDLQDRQVRWMIGELPTVPGDEALLRQVLMNLLGNAVKYTRGRQDTRIEVGARREDGEWIVSVRDNGVGFDPRYASRLFGVFQRLHRQEDFEGVGVGLANVQRIVTRHGGRVWAEGRAGEGAVFSFSLPEAQPDSSSRVV